MTVTKRETFSPSVKEHYFILKLVKIRLVVGVSDENYGLLEGFVLGHFFALCLVLCNPVEGVYVSNTRILLLLLGILFLSP